MAEFCMPSLGADMKAATLIEWKVKPGDFIKRGDIIAVVEADKGIIEIEVFEEGVVDKIIVPEGKNVPVGTVLAIISSMKEPSETKEEKIVEGQVIEKKETALKLEPEKVLVQEKPVPPLPEVLEGKKHFKVSPLARKLAEELNIDVSTIQGSGADGIINRADVEKAAKERELKKKIPVTEKAKMPKEVEYQAGMRRAIAAAMSRSNRDIPHYYLETRIDMTRALQWLEAENQKRSIKERLLPAVLLLKAVARALKDVPGLNGYWIDERHQMKDEIHIGFAISLRQGGLVVPAIHNVDKKSIDELMAAMSDLIARTRAGRLRSSEMTDATVTVTSLGDLGVETVYGVIYPPQVALVGFGRISEMPWAENGMLGIRRILSATLAADHRATDGNRGAQFLGSMKRYLQEVSML
ncbi:MAG: 2-oxo acid dehydrogenase subunit E2 [Planctomycetes bacterium]|nr:2-oxo acid dehydrogenase subunit E2 [Planctomycetota bacterium]